MERKLLEKVSKMQGCQERKLQLEENVQRLRSQLRDMKNTLEKYANNMTVHTEQTHGPRQWCRSRRSSEKVHSVSRYRLKQTKKSHREPEQKKKHFSYETDSEEEMLCMT